MTENGSSMSLVERFVDGIEAHMMYGVCEFVYQDVLGYVRIAFVPQQILLAATRGRSVRRGSQASGSFVPEALGLQVAVFRHVSGELVYQAPLRRRVEESRITRR